jgi:hypothetical protein
LNKDEILKLPLPQGIERMESGPIQFGEDWPGYYLRGDRAFGLIQGRETVLELLKTGDTRFSTLLWASASLNAIPDMARCIVGGWDGLPPVSLWQPIETAPRDGTEILVFGGEWEGEATGKTAEVEDERHIVGWDGETWKIADTDYYIAWINNPTHWMPLPTRPEVQS